MGEGTGGIQDEEMAGFILEKLRRNNFWMMSPGHHVWCGGLEWGRTLSSCNMAAFVYTSSSYLDPGYSPVVYKPQGSAQVT